MEKGFTVEEQQRIMFAKKTKVHEAFKVMTAILEAECVFDDSPQFNLFNDHDDFSNSVIIQFTRAIEDPYQRKIMLRAVDKLFDKA